MTYDGSKAIWTCVYTFLERLKLWRLILNGLEGSQTGRNTLEGGKVPDPCLVGTIKGGLKS